MALNVEESRQDHDQHPLESNVSSDEAGLKTKTTLSTDTHKPFQRIEFLVRDWQHFEDDEDLDRCILEMDNYLSSVLAERDATDLKDTRNQITSCFDFVGCYMLTHPGFSVTKKKYDGDVADIDPRFLSLLDHYCHRVFGCSKIEEKHGMMNNLVPKAIHGRELSAAELGAYIKAYANLFSKGATHFPEASTMLEATSSANNTNATNLSIQHYKHKMDALVGVRCSDYVSPNELEAFHRTFVDESMKIFTEIANFGSRKAIDQSKIIVENTIQENFQLFSQLNESRNPLAGIGM